MFEDLEKKTNNEPGFGETGVEDIFLDSEGGVNSQVPTPVPLASTSPVVPSTSGDDARKIVVLGAIVLGLLALFFLAWYTFRWLGGRTESVVKTPPSQDKPSVQSLTATSTSQNNNLDTDGDGLTDQEERNLGTNHLSADTDGDGLSDFKEEKEYLSDALLADTDNDGFSDGAEIAAGFNPLGDGSLSTGVEKIENEKNASLKELFDEKLAYKVAVSENWSRVENTFVGASSSVRISFFRGPLDSAKSGLLAQRTNIALSPARQKDLNGTIATIIDAQSPEYPSESWFLVPMRNYYLALVYDRSDLSAVSLLDSFTLVPDNKGRYLSEIDTDNDGLYDIDEYWYGTDAKQSDTDKDSYKDGDEVNKGYNPLGSGKLKK